MNQSALKPINFWQPVFTLFVLLSVGLRSITINVKEVMIMLTRRFVLCIIALAVLLGTYVGYQFYESRVESDELTSKPNPIQSNVDEGTELSEGTDLKKLLRKADTVAPPPPKLVANQIAYILTRDGKKIPFRLPEGMAYSKVMNFPPGTFPELEDKIAELEGKVEPPKLASVRYHIDDIPEGETDRTYGTKLLIAKENGISIEEVEELMASGKIIVTYPSEDPVKFTEFSEYRKHLESLGIDAETIAELERRHKLLEGAPPPQIENGVFPPSMESNGEGEPHQAAGAEMLPGDLDTARDDSTSPQEPLSPQEAIPKAFPKNESDWKVLFSQPGDDLAQGLDEEKSRWVAETLNRYGIEEGIRRIEAKDEHLAKRLRRNLETRDRRGALRSTKSPPSGGSRTSPK